MVFEILLEAAKRKELILIDGGYCRYHIKAGVLTIYEIISIRPGAGTEILNKLKAIDNVLCILASCPANYESNNWYKKKEFKLISQFVVGNKKRLTNIWSLSIKNYE